MHDIKINELSASTYGIFIRILCFMHNENNYGKILLLEKHRESKKKDKNIAIMLVKHLPYSQVELCSAIEELVQSEVLFYDGENLCCQKMIDDFEKYIIRKNKGRTSIPIYEFDLSGKLINTYSSLSVCSDNNNTIPQSINNAIISGQCFRKKSYFSRDGNFIIPKRKERGSSNFVYEFDLKLNPTENYGSTESAAVAHKTTIKNIYAAIRTRKCFDGKCYFSRNGTW